MWIDHPSEAQTRQLLTLWKAVFGEHSGFWEMFLRTAFTPEHCRCVLKDGQVAAALYWFDCTLDGQKLAYLYAVVTHPEHRGQGLCRMLMEDTHAHLQTMGYDGVLLVPEKESLRRMYEKMGYRTCTFVSEFSCAAGEEPLTVRAIGPEEYAALRRKLLPKGSVIQEGKNLTFLAEQAEFYVGNDFLLAAYRDGAVLQGMELLGSREAAPGILQALDCCRGNFHTPGTEIPFAMFYPLTKKSTEPAYFGFAFD